MPPWREAYHSPPTSGNVKNTWIYTSTPHTSLSLSDSLLKHKDSFLFVKAMWWRLQQRGLTFMNLKTGRAGSVACSRNTELGTKLSICLNTEENLSLKFLKFVQIVTTDSVPTHKKISITMINRLMLFREIIL
jgi:hypothetical protein